MESSLREVGSMPARVESQAATTRQLMRVFWTVDWARNRHQLWKKKSMIRDRYTRWALRVVEASP
jgi:hypothetical protein